MIRLIRRWIASWKARRAWDALPADARGDALSILSGVATTAETLYSAHYGPDPDNPFDTEETEVARTFRLRGAAARAAMAVLDPMGEHK